MRKFVGKLNIVSKCSTFFGHTYWTCADGFLNFHPRLCVMGGAAENQMVPGRKKTSTRHWLCVSVLVLASQIPFFVTALRIHYFSSSSQKANLHERFHTVTKLLMTFHHNSQNNHILSINFVEFWVHAFSMTSYHSWKWICKACL